jgi:hypothetical protein
MQGSEGLWIVAYRANDDGRATRLTLRRSFGPMSDSSTYYTLVVEQKDRFGRHLVGNQIRALNG